MSSRMVTLKRSILGACLLVVVFVLHVVDEPEAKDSSVRHWTLNVERRNYELRKPNCKLLFEGSTTETEYSKTYLNQSAYNPPLDETFIEAAQDCAAFKDGRYYSWDRVRPEEAAFPLSFGIRMHRNVAQVERLLRTVYKPQNVYCIYVDLKADARVHRAMAAISNCFDNVFIASRLHSFVYGSFSPVQADLQCMQDLLRSNIKWKYFINVAGSEFPLKTNLEMVHILSLLNGTNDIEQYPFPAPLNQRWQKIHSITDNVYVKTSIAKQPFFPPVPLQKGCSYNLFSRQFVQWVLTNETAQRFVKWTKDTSSPEEMIWATLNSLPGAPGGYQAIVTQIAKTFLAREVIWTWSAAHCFGQHFVHSICILSSPDLDWLSRRWELFANKFELNYDHVVLDCLEERHRNRTRWPNPEASVNWDMIRRAPHVADSISKNSEQL